MIIELMKNQLSSFDIIVKSYNEIKIIQNSKIIILFRSSLLLAIFYLNYIAIPVYEYETLKDSTIRGTKTKKGKKMFLIKLLMSNKKVKLFRFYIPEVLKSRSFALKILKQNMILRRMVKIKKLINIF